MIGADLSGRPMTTTYGPDRECMALVTNAFGLKKSSDLIEELGTWAC